jgi:hypothetical protein
MGCQLITKPGGKPDVCLPGKVLSYSPGRGRNDDYLYMEITSSKGRIRRIKQLISEGDKYTNLATYYFGHHPANRFEFSRGRDLVVEPGPTSGPINFLAYPVLEIEGKPVKTAVEFSFKRSGRRG